MTLARLERVAGACGAALGLGVYLVARSIPGPPSGGWMEDPAFWPRILAGAILVFSALLALRPGGPERTVLFAGAGRGLLLLALCAAYVWALGWAGYFAASTLWVVVVMLVAGERRWPVVVATSLLLTAAGYLLFWKVMVIALPIGIVDEQLGLASLYR